MNRIIKTCICTIGLLFIIIMTIPSNPLSHPYDEKTIYNLDQNSIKTATDPTTFVSNWNTAKVSSGSSGSNQVRLPLVATGMYYFTVSWGDGINTIIQSWNQTEVTHTYAISGEYSILIDGMIIGWRFNNRGDHLKIHEIWQWGCLRLGNEGRYFAGCANLNVLATDNLNLTGTTDLSEMFGGCTNFGSGGNLNEWDVSHVTNMFLMFYCASTFNQPLGTWKVSSVTNMGAMFAGASTFNQTIEAWDVSSVTIMDMMFYNASSFNQPLGAWNVSKVHSITGMFYNASNFNHPLENWDVSSVQDMDGMFFNASSFNQPLENWDVSNVQIMAGMFSHASAFNQSLGAWDVSNVQVMNEMFYKASSFNQPLGTWIVSNVMHMHAMFSYASTFNQPLGTWDVSHVIDMHSMFYCASTFNQPLGTWNVSDVVLMEDMFSGANLSTANYDQLLLGWSQLTLHSGVIFDAGISKFNAGAATAARQLIIDTYDWDIRDGGQVPSTTTEITTTSTTSTIPTPTNPFSSISGSNVVVLGIAMLLGTTLIIYRHLRKQGSDLR